MNKFVAVFLFLVTCAVFCVLLVIFSIEGSPRTPFITATPHNNHSQRNRKQKKFPRVQNARFRWRGDCLFPSYLSYKLQKQPWFPKYLHHLERVKLPTEDAESRSTNCARWWHHTPHTPYQKLPHRKNSWKKNNPTLWRENITRRRKPHKRVKCGFGQKLVASTRCGSLHEVLWVMLNKMGVVYFPRAGTELGIVRG